MEASDQMGLAFARAILLVNGGAFVLLMAHLGSSSADPLLQIGLTSIRRAMAGFLVGVASILAAFLVSHARYSFPSDTRPSIWLGEHIVLNNLILDINSISGFLYGVFVLLIGASVS